MRFFFVMAFIPAFILCGCAGNDRPPVLKVSGEVTVGGKPVDGALVVFHPQGKDRERDVKPFAKTNEQGKFNLSTYGQDDGAPEGDYAITIVWNKPGGPEPKMSITGEGGPKAGPDRLNGRFGTPSATPLKKTVKKGDANEFKFELN